MNSFYIIEQNVRFRNVEVLVFEVRIQIFLLSKRFVVSRSNSMSSDAKEKSFVVYDFKSRLMKQKLNDYKNQKPRDNFSRCLQRYVFLHRDYVAHA